MKVEIVEVVEYSLRVFYTLSNLYEFYFNIFNMNFFSPFFSTIGNNFAISFSNDRSKFFNIEAFITLDCKI